VACRETHPIRPVMVNNILQHPIKQLCIRTHGYQTFYTFIQPAPQCIQGDGDFFASLIPWAAGETSHPTYLVYQFIFHPTHFSNFVISHEQAVHLSYTPICTNWEIEVQWDQDVVREHEAYNSMELHFFVEYENVLMVVEGACMLRYSD
jgi:hypothetical protein